MLLEVPQALETEIDEVEAHMQAIMNDTLKMDRRSKTRALRRINGKLSQFLQERDDYLSGKKLRQFEASLVCKKAPKMSRKPGDDWTPDARRYCKERRNKLVRIERKADDLMGDAEKEELRRQAEAEAAAPEQKARGGGRGRAQRNSEEVLGATKAGPRARPLCERAGGDARVR